MKIQCENQKCGIRFKEDWLPRWKAKPGEPDGLYVLCPACKSRVVLDHAIKKSLEQIKKI